MLESLMENKIVVNSRKNKKVLSALPNLKPGTVFTNQAGVHGSVVSLDKDSAVIEINKNEIELPIKDLFYNFKKGLWKTV